MFFVLSLICVCPSFALEEVSSEGSVLTDEDISLMEIQPEPSASVSTIEDEADVSTDEDIALMDIQPEAPVPVTIIEDEAVYPSLYASSAPVLVIGDTPPVDSPFYGSGWITGHSSTLGNVTLYFPVNYSTGYWGVDSDGYLFNVTSSSMSGYLDGVYHNSVSAPAFSYPRYRPSSGSDYINLYIKPTNSNMDIATSHTPRYTAVDFLPYLTVFLLGVICLCYMKRS